MRKCTFFFLSFLFVFAGVCCAQVIPPERSESGHVIDASRIGSHYSVLPVAGYTSDLGFVGGGFFQRRNYGIDVRPYLSNLEADITFSTKGNIDSSVEYERTRSFGTDIRSSIIFVGERSRRAHYFGIGNGTDFSETLYDEGRFFFENRHLHMRYMGRKNVLEYGESGELDLYGSVTVSRFNGITRGDDTRFEDDMPDGFGKNWTNKLGIGFITDSRDDEFMPTRGKRYEAEFSASLPLLGSGYSYSDIRINTRHFIRIFDGVVLAHNAEMHHIFGEAPFWDLPFIGSEAGLRGYHRYRFRGNSSILNILELRTWLFSFLDGGIRAGVQAFWDTGRVFSDFDSNHIFDEWKHSFGAGGVLSLFHPDFFVRGDIGFSDETMRIYFGTGYIF